MSLKGKKKKNRQREHRKKQTERKDLARLKGDCSLRSKPPTATKKPCLHLVKKSKGVKKRVLQRGRKGGPKICLGGRKKSRCPKKGRRLPLPAKGHREKGKKTAPSPRKNRKHLGEGGTCKGKNAVGEVVKKGGLPSWPGLPAKRGRALPEQTRRKNTGVKKRGETGRGKKKRATC